MAHACAMAPDCVNYTSRAMTHTCPVCGFAELAEPPYDSAGCASFEICPSCGTEFGYRDAKASHEELRTRWLSAGGRWSDNGGTASLECKGATKGSGDEELT